MTNNYSTIYNKLVHLFKKARQYHDLLGDGDWEKGLSDNIVTSRPSLSTFQICFSTPPIETIATYESLGSGLSYYPQGVWYKDVNLIRSNDQKVLDKLADKIAVATREVEHRTEGETAKKHKLRQEEEDKANKTVDEFLSL
jgi:hypothetical protein